MIHASQRRRRWLVGTAAVTFSLLASGLTGVNPAYATTPAPHLSIVADPLTVHVGSAISLSGTATPRVAGVAVFLQRFSAGHWVNLTHKITPANGGYAFRIRASSKPTTWIFRVVRHGNVAVSRTRHIKISSSSFRVSATTKSKVVAGKPLVFTGSVSPKATGAVRLEYLAANAWHTLANAKLSTTSTFTIKASRPAGAYRLRVVKPFSSTFATGVSSTKLVAVVKPGQPVLRIAGTDSAKIGLSAPRLVFSAVRGHALPAPRHVTLSNSGTSPVTVSGLSISGNNPSSYGLASGQPATVTVPAAGSTTVAIQFHPTAPTGCPSPGNLYGVSDSNRYATLTFSSTDPAFPVGSVNLAGLISCDFGGANEPVLHQIVQALGYTTVVDTASMDQRFLKTQSIYPGTNEVTSPYFHAADASKPVTVTDLAHYSSASLTPYHATGWFTKGASIPSDGSCGSACHKLWAFPADASTTTYNQNQKLLPSTVGTTSFTTSATFGLFSGDNKDVVFSVEGLNDPTAKHDMRVYPAYGPGHVAIAHAYLVAVDTGRKNESKNGDYQDIVMIVRNVIPG